MRSCSLVHSSWRAAANLTRTEITCDPDDVSSLSAWLQANCAKVPVRSIRAQHYRHATWRICPDRLVLPGAQLRFLQSLALDNVFWVAPAAPEAAAALAPAGPQHSSGSSLVGLRPLESRRRRRQAAAAAPTPTQQASQAAGDSLSSLTALTRLDLEGKSVMLGGLSALAGLKELRCKGTAHYSGNFGMTLDDLTGPSWWTPELKQDMLDAMFPDNSIPAFASTHGALVAALPHLGHSLTSLELGQDMSSQRVIAGVSSLRRLQRLLLPDTQASSFAGLPRTLTELRLSVIGVATAGRLVQPDTAAALAQLTSMCVLTLDGFIGLDTAVFSGMSSLRELSLSRVTFAPAADQLLFVSKLTALQSLTIDSGPTGQQDITAAEAAALTATQQLASLALLGLSMSGKLQAPQYSSMFPVGRRLSSLTGLQVGSSFLQDAAVVTLAANCCVALTSLEVTWDRSRAAGADMAANPAVQLVGGVRSLTGFGSLASLTLNIFRETLPRCIWSSLATLTDLRSLTVVSLRPDYSHALALTRCQRLESLRLEGSDHAEDLAYHCDIFVGATPLKYKASCAGACVLTDLACWLCKTLSCSAAHSTACSTACSTARSVHLVDAVLCLFVVCAAAGVDRHSS
jgi:hypothetical protein